MEGDREAGRLIDSSHEVGIVGAGIPIATGSALALKMRGNGDIAVVYFGDGGLAEGVVHECFNLAALWSLPVLFVCENNGYSGNVPASMYTAVDDLAVFAVVGVML